MIQRIESGGPTFRLRRTTPLAAELAVDDVLVWVVDVSQAQCVLGVTPGRAFLIDAGHWQGGAYKAAIDELVPADEGLALVILTHNDSDHLGELSSIVGSRGIDTLVWNGRTPAKCNPRSGNGCAGTYLTVASNHPDPDCLEFRP